MKTSTKRLLVVISIVTFALVVYAGSAWAQSDPATATPPSPTNMLQQMEQRFGPQAWAEHIQQMTQIHGADFVSQRLAWMAQQESCPGMNGEGRGMGTGMGMMQQRQGGMRDDANSGMMGRGMMQQRQGGMRDDANGGMMGRGMMGNGMMGRGMSGQGSWWGFSWNRGLHFWNNTPTVSPTPTPSE